MLADVRLGNRVIVFGAGTVGLFCAAVAREFGASTVVSVDVLARRLQFSRKFIGNSVGSSFMPNDSFSVEEVARQLVKLGEGADIAIDASGAKVSVQTAIFSLQKGGTSVQVGMRKRKIEFPISEMREKEINSRDVYGTGLGILIWKYSL